MRSSSFSRRNRLRGAGFAGSLFRAFEAFFEFMIRSSSVARDDDGVAVAAAAAVVAAAHPLGLRVEVPGGSDALLELLEAEPLGTSGRRDRSRGLLRIVLSHGVLLC